MKDCLEWRAGELPAAPPKQEKPAALTTSARVNACIKEGEKRGHTKDPLTAFIEECTGGAYLDEAGQAKN